MTKLLLVDVWAALPPEEQRALLELAVINRFDLHDAEAVQVRFRDRANFTRVEVSTLVGFLSLADLFQCLTDHPREIMQFLLGKMDEQRPGARFEMDDKGTEWLVLDGTGVDFGADDVLGHAASPVASPSAGRNTATKAGGLS